VPRPLPGRRQAETWVPKNRILMGVIGRPHGVRGLLRVTSYAEDLAVYGPLSDAKGRRFVVRPRGAGVQLTRIFHSEVGRGLRTAPLVVRFSGSLGQRALPV